MTDYRPASEVARIATKLIADHHIDLCDVRIEYVFRHGLWEPGVTHMAAAMARAQLAGEET